MAEPFRMVLRDAAHDTHALTNGRVRLSVWAGELDRPELEQLRDQLERGASQDARGQAAGILGPGKLRQLEEAGLQVVRRNG